MKAGRRAARLLCLVLALSTFATVFLVAGPSVPADAAQEDLDVPNLHCPITVWDADPPYSACVVDQVEPGCQWIVFESGEVVADPESATGIRCEVPSTGETIDCWGLESVRWEVDCPTATEEPPWELPEEDPTGRPNDSCELRRANFTFDWWKGPWQASVREFTVYGNGSSYWLCTDDPHRAGCEGDFVRAEPLTDSWLSMPLLGETYGWGGRLWVCPGEEGYTWARCRDDIRWHILGPALDDDYRWDSRDLFGIALIPDDAPHWVSYEIELESEADKGQGCTLADHMESLRNCDQLRADKAGLRQQIAHMEAREEEERSGGDSTGIDRRELEGLREELRELERQEGGSIIPDDCWGTYPNSHYQITWDASDDGLTDPGRLMGWLASILFGFSKLAVSAMLWLVRLAFTFDVTEFRETVGDFAGNIDRQLVHLGDHPFSLFDVAWFALFAYAGFQAVRGRIGRAGSEIVASIVLAGLGLVLVGNFFPRTDDDNFRSRIYQTSSYDEGGYFDSFGDLLNLSGVALLRIANDEDPNVSPRDVDRDFIESLLVDANQRLHMEFVERPYMFVQWGTETFDSTAGAQGRAAQGLPEGYAQMSCREVFEALLAVPDKSSLGYWTANFMERHGCLQEAQFNRNMNVERLMSTVLITAVALIVSALVGLAAVTLLLSKFLVAVFFVALPVAVVMAVLPGRSRQMAWGWATSLLQLWLAALGMGLVVALLVMGLDAIHRTTEDRELSERWIMVLLLVSTVYMLRKRIVSGTQSAARAVADRLTSSTGATPNWAGAGAGGGGTGGVDLMGADRSAAKTGFVARSGAVMAGSLGAMAAWGGIRMLGRGTMAPFGGLYRTGRQRRQENRQARKAQKWHWSNLKHAQDLGHARDVLSDPTKSKNAVLKRLDHQHDHELNSGRRELREGYRGQRSEMVGRMKEKHYQGRLEDAALARHDADRLKSTIGRGRRIKGDDMVAARRLGFSPDEVKDWNNHLGGAGAGSRLTAERFAARAEGKAQAAERRIGGYRDAADAERVADPKFARRVDKERMREFRSDVKAGVPGDEAVDRQKFAARERARWSNDGDYQAMRSNHQRDVERVEGDRALRKPGLDAEYEARRQWVRKNMFSVEEARRFSGDHDT